MKKKPAMLTLDVHARLSIYKINNNCSSMSDAIELLLTGTTTDPSITSSLSVGDVLMDTFEVTDTHDRRGRRMCKCLVCGTEDLYMTADLKTGRAKCPTCDKMVDLPDYLSFIKGLEVRGYKIKNKYLPGTWDEAKILCEPGGLVFRKDLETWYRKDNGRHWYPEEKEVKELHPSPDMIAGPAWRTFKNKIPTW